jgi:hypothetical protein
LKGCAAVLASKKKACTLGCDLRGTPDRSVSILGSGNPIFARY